MEAKSPKIPDFLIASATMMKDSALGNSNLVNFTMDSIYYLKLEVQKCQRLKIINDQKSK